VSAEGVRFEASEASWGCPLPLGRSLGRGLRPSQKIFLLIFGKWAIFVQKTVFQATGETSPSDPSKYATRPTRPSVKPPHRTNTINPRNGLCQVNP